MVGSPFVETSSLVYSALIGKLRRMRGSRGALELLEQEANGEQCSESFGRALDCAYERAQWGGDGNLVVRAAALLLTNPQTRGLPSVPMVVNAVKRMVMEEGANRRRKMMEERIAIREGLVASAPLPVRKSQRIGI